MNCQRSERFIIAVRSQLLRCYCQFQNFFLYVYYQYFITTCNYICLNIITIHDHSFR